MPQDNLIKLECSNCHHINYYTRRNKKAVKERLKLSKFCAWCGKHTPHKENK